MADLEDRGIVRAARTAPDVSLSTIHRVTGTEVSTRIIAKRLQKRRQHSTRPLRLPLSCAHRQQRLQWCQARLTRDRAQRARTDFSDESRFVLGSDDWRIGVYRWPDQFADSAFTVEKTHGSHIGNCVLRRHFIRCCDRNWSEFKFGYRELWSEALFRLML